MSSPKIDVLKNGQDYDVFVDAKFVCTLSFGPEDTFLLKVNMTGVVTGIECDAYGRPYYVARIKGHEFNIYDWEIVQS